MKIQIGFDITIQRYGAAPLLLALSLRPEEEARLVSQSDLTLNPYGAVTPFIDAFGNRRLRVAAGSGPLRLQWQGTVEDHGQPDFIDPSARITPVEQLPHEVLQFLAPSRYCQSDVLMTEAWSRFGHLPEDWSRVQAVLDFVHGHISFGYGYASAFKTAQDAFNERQGVCRDFAHLTITLCRALNIPARYVSGYLGDIGVPYAGPGDFCAWVEVYVGGRWYTVDARHNTPRIGRVKMVEGRDAVDVPMITSFGQIAITQFAVNCDEVLAVAA